MWVCGHESTGQKLSRRGEVLLKLEPKTSLTPRCLVVSYQIGNPDKAVLPSAHAEKQDWEFGIAIRKVTTHLSHK